MSFNWTQVPVRLLRRNAYDVAMKEYERQVTEEVSAKNRQAQIAAVAPNRGWMHHISSENNKADAYRIAWEVTMQKLQQQERQREWDAQAAQNQYWAKTQEKAQSSLAKTGEMLNLDPLARQRRIAEETYRLASQDAQSKGDFETAQEYERRMRLAMGDKTSAIEQATPEDLSSGLVKRTVEQGPAQPQGALSRYAQYAEEKDPQRVASMKALGQKASAFKDELLSPETRQEAVAGWKQSKRGEFMFSAGVGGIMQSLGGALEAYGKNGQWLVDAGTRIQAEATRGLPEAKNKGEQYSDAIWASAPFLIGSMGLAMGALQGAAALGLGATATWVLGSLLGGAAGAAFESVDLAGQSYLEAKNRGASQDVAKEAYDYVLKRNLAVIGGLDVVQMAVAFMPTPAKLAAKVASSTLLKTIKMGSKVAIVGLTEGGEEVYQDMLQKKAQGDPFYWNPEKWDEDTKLAFAVGTIMGVGFGAGGDVLTVGPKVRAIAPETFDMAHDSAVAEGKSEDIAVAEAIIEVAKENPQAVEAIIPQQAAVQQERAPSVEKQGTEGIVSQEGTTVAEQSTGKQHRRIAHESMGNETVAYDADGKAHNLKFAVVDLGQLVASHTDAFAENPSYPQELQPRDRSRAASRSQVDQIVSKFHPEQLLIDSKDLSNGAPIIGPDMVVESGNGRTLALRRVARQRPGAFAEYQSQLRQSLTGYGIDPSAIEGMSAPVLVRVREGGTTDRAKFASSANQRTTMAMSPYEQALEDTNRVSASGIAKLVISENETVEQALRKLSNQALAQELLRNVSANERASLVDQDGAINATGVQRLKWAMFAKTYTGEAGERLVRTFSESIDPVVQNVQSAMFASLPQTARAEALVASKQRDQGLSIAPMMAKVVERYAWLKQSGGTVADYLSQYDMFAEPLSQTEGKLLLYLENVGGRAPKQLREFLRYVAQRVENSPQVGQGSLIALEPVTLEGVINDAIDKTSPNTAEDISRQSELFGSIPRVGAEARQGMEQGGGVVSEAPLWKDQGQIIGGVEAYDPMRGIFEYDPTESIKRLFPESNIGKITQAAGKLPFGEEAVGFFNPTLTPRESLAAQTVQEHGAVANDLVYRVASGRKAYIGNLAKSLFPEGDAVKHFQVDDMGIQHAFKAKREGAPMGIVDVLENPQNYELDAPAKEFVKLWRKVHSQAITELDKRGIKVNQKFYEEGGGYFPRMVRSAYGEEVNVPRVKYRKPRSFATQEEGIYNEIGYTIDPIHNINGFIDETFRIIAAHDLKQVVDSVGRTAKDSVPVSIRIARDEAVKRHKVMLRAYSAAQRAKRGEKLPSATIRSIEGMDESVARLVDGKDTKALKAFVDESRRAAIRARKDYSVALEKARGPKLGSFERGTIHPAFKGQWFSEETAKVLDALAPKAASDAWRRVQSVNEAMRTVKANFDFSPGTIQGLNVLARAPHKWGEVTAKSFEWLLKPENAPKWFAKHGDIISRHPDIVQGTHEYYAGQEVIKTKLGKPGRAIAKAMTPFENYFTNWGDAARVLMAEALEPSFVKAGTPERLGTYINRMTGVMDTRALGVSGKQRAFESLMLFAPRYTRASVAYIGTAMEGGVMGAEARKTIALLIGAGTLFWMGMQKAMGEEPAWPNSPNFWTVKMGNRRVGMGGFMYSFIRLLADSYQSIASEGGNAPSDFKEWDRTNPIINFLSKRTSVLWRAALTVRDETDFMGYPIEGFDEWAHYFMVEMMAPISIQEQLTGANEDAPSNRLGVAAAELFGLRTFPENEYYALADKYAQAAYGKDWNELSKPTKAGSYSQSPEQKRLLQMHPDLKAAYDAQKDRASERWKAQHDLLGDKNISRDAWAREMFGKDYKDLPKEYQKQVDEAIARG